MMQPTLIVPLGMAFLLIGALPLVFFRHDGRLTGRWWLTAAPLFLGGGAVAAAAAGLFAGWRLTGPAAGIAAGLAAALATGAVGLIAYTIGTHRRRIALWHQDGDAPEEIVTDGAYALVRHPFYAAFLGALAAAALAAPSPVTLAALAWGGIALSLTARHEERRLLASRFGDGYRAYMARTGRLLPGIG